MKIRTSITIGLAILFATIVSILTISSFKVKGEANIVQSEIPVVIKSSVSSFIDVQCERAFSSNTNTLSTFSCDLLNRGNVGIRSVGANYSLVADVNGVERRDTFLKVVDAFIHPDISKEILPGKMLNISPSGPMSIPNGVIKRLEIEVIYIEFGDGRSLGESGKTVEKVADIRLGASTYKAWIKKEYLNRGQSEEELVPLLDKNSAFGPTGNKKFGNEVGEKYYKNFLRERYRVNGRGSIRSLLDR